MAGWKKISRAVLLSWPETLRFSGLLVWLQLAHGKNDKAFWLQYPHLNINQFESFTANWNTRNHSCSYSCWSRFQNFSCIVASTGTGHRSYYSVSFTRGWSTKPSWIRFGVPRSSMDLNATTRNQTQVAFSSVKWIGSSTTHLSIRCILYHSRPTCPSPGMHPLSTCAQ